MKSRPFFTRRIPFFGNYAMVVMCLVFFTLPFIIRGARQGIDTMENKVADWLPSDFPETTELRWFRQHFVGDQFVVISWDGCYENDYAYDKLVGLLKEESVEEQDKEWSKLNDWSNLDSDEQTKMLEQIDATTLADRLKLHTTGDYHENWSANNVKWLVGEKSQWYFLNHKGELYEWRGQNNVIAAIGRTIETYFEAPIPTGHFIKQFDSEYYDHPSRLHARFFKKVTTGPDIFREMAGPEGTMRVGKYGEDDVETLNVEIEAHKRLTGLLFGPTPKPEFNWTWRSLKAVVPERHRQDLKEEDEAVFVNFVEQLVSEKFDNDIRNLMAASQDEKLEHWYRLWARLSPKKAPPRQTCIIVSLNDTVLSELARAVGRPVLGKPRGRILELASGKCGIEPDNLHIGGPPVDNVAIDEEGAITLFRLVSLSAGIGLTLAWLSFRSIRVTLMLFFVGGTAAMASLAIVYFSGATMDAILMTMPSLIYVLGLSGAVHIVNYYREACEENGPHGAAETAVRHGLFPCTLAAFTTALGLISLFTSNLTPIKKFGLFSAIATLATVVLLFSYLPAALTIWPSGYKKRNREDQEKTGFNLADHVAAFWRGVCELVIRHNKIVAVTSAVLMLIFAVGVTQIQTSIQLLKLFRSDAKILADYRWMEDNMGKLVPMELIISVDDDIQRRNVSLDEQGEPVTEMTEDQLLEYQARLSMLQRMELSDRIRKRLQDVFGENGLGVVGSVMSTDVAINLDAYVSSQNKTDFRRNVTDADLLKNRDKLMETDYVREENTRLDGSKVFKDEPKNELWRVSLRLAGLNDVDYGEFGSELKTVVEPIMSAYRYRTKIIREMQEQLGSKSLIEGRILVLGPNPKSSKKRSESAKASIDISSSLTAKPKTATDYVDQTYLFSDTLFDLMMNAGYTSGGKTKGLVWLSPDAYDPFPSADVFAENIAKYDCIVLVDDHQNFDIKLIKEHAKAFIDARGHRYELDEFSRKPLANSVTARELKDAGDIDTQVFTAYTGIIPIVYKAQRTLLQSLIESIGLAFILIAFVMMLLLRNWKEKMRLHNILNFRGGLIAMLPNIFPLVIVFGAMGHLRGLGVKVDIGSMMTASVAMGVAVDDTIHFLNWYRQGLQQGKSRHDAIRLSFDKVATAMTQTTLIAGLGLSAFAFSTFMPTQRFGVLMLVLLAVALIGDLVFLPALLSSPLGKFMGKELTPEERAIKSGTLILSSTGASETNHPQAENGSAENGTSGNGVRSAQRSGSIVPNPLLNSPQTKRKRSDAENPNN